MQVETTDYMAASRLERVQYYLERRLGKEDLPTHVLRRLRVMDAISDRGYPPINYSSMQDYIEGMTSPNLPAPTSEPMYHSKWMSSVYEETEHLLVTPPGDHGRVFALADVLRAKCGFTPPQMNKFINGITETQLKAWEQAIEQSRIPLTYSWTEPEVLFEILLATGQKPASLMDAAVAYYDPTSAGSTHKVHPIIEGGTWLLEATLPNKGDAREFHCLEVEFRPRGLWGEGKPMYRLAHNNNTYGRSMQDALDYYMYMIDYCNGLGASQAVQILKPHLLS